MKPKALVVLALWGSGGAALAAPARPDVQGLLAGVPLHFERNDGQVDSRVRFLARGSGYGLYLTADEAVLALRGGSGKTGDSRLPEVVRWRLVGGNPSAEVGGEELLPGQANYLVGSDPSGWRTDVPLYRRVRYADVYPGISLVYYGDQRRLEYDLELAPEADPRRIRFRIDGARSIRLDDEGRLRIRTQAGELVQHAPVVYQSKDGVREPVAARFRRFGTQEVGFEVASYDRRRPLVIDPKIDFSTYLGGTEMDEATDVALAGNLDVYVTGTTASLDFRPPLSMVAEGRARARNDIFVVKLRFDGSSLAVSYATYLGGSGDDFGVGIALESDGKAVVLGQTDSADIYTTKTFGLLGGNDVWVARLNTTGDSIEYAAQVGGDKSDEPTGIAVDGARDVHVVGRTFSDNYPTAGSSPPPIQTGLRGPQDAFFSVLVANASSLAYSTFMGGGFGDEANGIALHSGLAYIAGTTDSDDFPVTPGVFQPAIGGGASGVKDAFLMLFVPAGVSRDLAFSTYFGGKHGDSGLGVAADASGVYITGSTGSVDTFPRQNPFQATYGGGASDAFVAKLRSNGSVLLFSTFLGGGDLDTGSGVEVDSLLYVYVTGTTFSPDFPVWRPLPPPLDKLQGASDAFLTRLAPPGCALDYSTFLGGKTEDDGAALAITPSGTVVVVGRTTSNDFPELFPLTGGYQGGVSDAFATLVSDNEPPADLEVRKTASPSTAVVGRPLRYTVSVKNLSLTRPAYEVVLQDNLPPAAEVTFVSSSPGSPVCNIFGQTLTCGFLCVNPQEEITVTIDVTVNLPAYPSILNEARITVPGDPNSSNDLASIMTPVILPADMEVLKTNITPPVRSVGQNIDYSVRVTNNGPGQANGIVMKDTLPPETTFVQVFPPCPPPVGGVLTCGIATLAQGSFVTYTVTVLATSAGVVTNHASVSAAEPDNFPGNDSATAMTTVVVPAGAVEFFTVRSSNGENLLEWKNPVLGPTAEIAIFRNGTTPTCAFETNPTLGSPIHVVSSPPSDAYASFVDNVGLTNGVTYCYSIYVDIDGGGTNFSPGRFNRGRPFDTTIGNVRWEFNIGTSSLAPIGNGIGIVHSVANDANLYAMMKGTALAGGLGGGKWPTGYLPYPIIGPSQGRPGSIPLSPGPPSRGTFLSSDDGRVYAIDSDHGSGGTELWISPVLGGGGTALVAPPSGSFTLFGATRDLIYVGSRDPAGSQLFALRLADGQPVGPGGWVVNGAPFGTIGPVSGQAAVDYVARRVYFASRASGVAPNNRTVWCVDFETGLVLWAQAHGDVDAAVSLRGNHLYVATNDGRVLALRTSDGGADWTFTVPGAEGVAKGYVVTNFLNTNVYFSTATRVWSLRDDGASFFLNWGASGVPLPGGIPGNSPSTPVYAPGAPHVWVGGSDNRLHRLNVGDGSGFDSFVLGDAAVPTAVGSPTLDLSGGFVYVGTEAGRVYAIQP
jgi:uncharacterized repeat protein (TIGR01451 family)